MIILSLLIIYIFGVYVLPRFIVPNYGFHKSSLPDRLPANWQNVLDSLQKKSANNEEFLRSAYDYITTTYQGGRFRTLIDLKRAFQDPLSLPPGYMHCHNQNYLLRALLVKSGRFTEDDIVIRTVFFNFFTHQYLQVRLKGKWIFVDPAGKALGIPFGKRAYIFG